MKLACGNFYDGTAALSSVLSSVLSQCCRTAKFSGIGNAVVSDGSAAACLTDAPSSAPFLRDPIPLDVKTGFWFMW
jgi:hypothetical protein